MSPQPLEVPVAATSGREEARAASLRRLHGLVRSINGDLDLGRALTAVCRGVVEGLGFGVAVVNLVQPDGDLEVVACEGNDLAMQALLGQRGTRAFWEDLLGRCQPMGDLLVDYAHAMTELTAGGAGQPPGEVPIWMPDPSGPRVEGGWDPEDMLLAPLHTRGSGLLGVLSVDLPDDGLRPGPEQLELLEMYAAQASVAIENAQLHSSLKAQDEARTRALGRLTAVVDSAPVAIVELDLDGRVCFWNGAAEGMFGWTEAEVLGHRNPVAPEGPYVRRLQELRSSGTIQRVQATRSRRDGTELDLEMTTTALLDEGGQAYGYLGVYVDVTHRRQLEQELRTAAFTDPLTGLANRARFTARLAATAEDAHVVLLDLDGFKGVNDTLGHAAGDRLLVEVARRLRAVCREQDLVARLGGDEFVVLLSPSPSPSPADATDAAESLAGRLVEVLAVPFELGDRRVQLGASVGLARAGAGSAAGADPGDGGRALGEALLRDADVAMYAAKAEGKGRVRVFEPALREAVVERTELVQDLRAALARDELFLRWQPVAEVSTGRVVGLEALVRWRHPQRGELAPSAFVGLAEETGLVVGLGAHVLRQACATLSEWQSLRPRPGGTGRPLSAAVNLSPVQVHAPGLVDTVRSALRESGVPPQSLVLELTEDVLLRDTEPVLAVLSELRELGVRVAVDDFGAGYSSLSYLRRLPLDLVKLDRSLLVDADRDPAALALLDAVVALTRRLGLLACAEGVETPEQWELLRRLHCRLAQGRLLSAPLLPHEVPALLARGLGPRVPRQPVPR